MKKFSIFLISVAGFCWGLIGLFSNFLKSEGFSPIQITAFRNIISATLLFLYLFLFKKDKLQIHIKDFYLFIGTGVFSILLFNTCYFTALEIIPMSIASILLYTAPSIVMILSAFLFKEKLTSKKLFSLILAFVGCVLVTGVVTNKPLPILGILSGLGSGFGYALYSIFGRFALRKYHSLTVTFYTFLVASVAVLFFTDLPDMAFEVLEKPYSLLYALLLSVVSTLIPYLCYTKGLEFIEPGTASIIASIEPVIATLTGVFVFEEVLTFYNVLGISLIILAIIIVNLPTAKK